MQTDPLSEAVVILGDLVAAVSTAAGPVALAAARLVAIGAVAWLTGWFRGDVCSP